MESRSVAFHLHFRPRHKVPFLINGTYKMFEENGNRMVTTKVTITYYPAIETAGMERAEITCRFAAHNNQCIGARCPFSAAARSAT